MKITSEKLDDYLYDHSENEGKYLIELEKQTWQKVLSPNMISGKFQGRFLSMITKLINPKYILEIGTFTGYSSLCLAEGLQKNGKLITIDTNEELIKLFTEQKIKNSEFAKYIEIKIGNALEIIPKLNYEFDLIFIDADKKNYINYFNLIIDKLPKGGVIISDNVLWKGKVLGDTKDCDIDTRILIEYNDILSNDKRVEHIILPIRDGVSISRKV